MMAAFFTGKYQLILRNACSAERKTSGTADEKNGSECQDGLCDSLTCHFAEVSPKEGVKVVSKMSMHTKLHFPTQAFKKQFHQQVRSSLLPAVLRA